MSLSVVIITLNEQANLARTLASVGWAEEIVIVDSGSTDGTREVAASCGAKFFVEPWRGFAGQKNLAIDKASSDWVLSLDADEEVSPELQQELRRVTGESDSPAAAASPTAYTIPRKNHFLGRWMKHGGFYPDRKLRLFRRGTARFEERAVHETVRPQPGSRLAELEGALVHHAYPTLAGYVEHMNRYSSLAAESLGPRGFSVIDIFLRPRLTFVYNYFLRLGFLDGREGFLLHLYHAAYVSWKYAKAWELQKASHLEGRRARDRVGDKAAK